MSLHIHTFFIKKTYRKGRTIARMLKRRTHSPKAKRMHLRGRLRDMWELHYVLKNIYVFVLDEIDR